ncbi:uncharacterized protein LTR77_006851 [Saxophila tyrrhenica]|uniref:PhoD-like phosphatase domain-containing protein n=1 Tax=Saxophila tyrrhenica TaxID=1690608 RepID=A0AAV9P811_9PEZI|nr:hypothetical protein LTR77_006851 [Saxophila tyrrhenica]
MTTNGDAAPQAPVSGVGNGPQVLSTTAHLEVICGPLLNYRRMSNEHSSNPIWHGSVLIVTTPGQRPEPLRLRLGGLTGSNDASAGGDTRERTFEAIKLYEDPRKAFFNYEIDLPFQEQESRWEYLIPDMVTAGGMHRQDPDKPTRFWVPSKHESFRIMFHSCNGFSVGTDMETWKGPSLWNDVLRMQAQQPFHVMIGGGDQIYNDSVRTDGPLKPWTAIGNPRKRREFPFDEDMRARCDQYYYDNYVTWYGTEPFAAANAQIPQLNIWDDHDIIDGFGSYTDHFMQCAVFRGIGGVAHKYYMLFQHHIPPPASTFTTAAKESKHHGVHSAKAAAPKLETEGQPLDPVQLERTFVMKPTHEDPSYIMGPRAGPYVEERSRNMYCQLGKRIAYAGIDARTERTRHQINYPETYELFFNHLSKKIGESNGEIKHLVLLLGVPIAYPRLQWLENILQSPLIGPIRFLNKRFGVAGGLFNQFDGGVDLLDDLDDHYTAHQHKKERKDLIHRIQNLAKEHSVRVTILGGDVHLTALGRFYSKPELNIPAEKDFRYVPNIISSAITNKPPPQAVANLLAKRNKIHHLDHETDETLLELFDKQPGAGEPGVKPKSAAANKCTMPSRNYAIIAESHPNHGSTGAPNGALANGDAAEHGDGTDFTLPKNMREPIHKGELHAGAAHPAATGLTRTGLAGLDGLDVTIRVEKNPEDTSGYTEGYGFSVPALDSRGFKGHGRDW